MSYNYYAGSMNRLLLIFKFRNLVAQLAKATGRHQTEDAAVPGSNPEVT
jgi:hypothetical protein